MEHRQRIRHPALGLLNIHYDGNKEISGLMYNASLGGMFIVTTANVDINASLVILFNVSVYEKQLQISGLVTHSNNNGFGMMFRNLNFSARLFVNNLCHNI